LAVFINLFLPFPLDFFDFIPSFLAAIFAIYISKLGTLREGLLAAFMTYIFNEGILNTIGLASLYLTNEPYTSSIYIWMVFSPTVTLITAVIAGYVGVWLGQKMKLARELPPSLPPPLPPV